MCDGDGICTIFEINKRVPMTGFIQFVTSITIKTKDMTPFLYIESYSIKELVLEDLYKQNMDYIQKMLKNVEIIDIQNLNFWI